MLRRLPPGQVAARLLPVAVTPGAGLASWPILTDLRIPDAIGAEDTSGHTDWTPITWAVRARLEALPTTGNGLNPAGPPDTHPVTWLPNRPRFHFHFTPTSGSRLNLVEVYSAIIDRQAIRRGVFTSVKDLNAKIRQFITGWNNSKRPFVGTNTPDEILKKANRRPNSNRRHNLETPRS